MKDWDVEDKPRGARWTHIEAWIIGGLIAITTGIALFG